MSVPALEDLLGASCSTGLPPSSLGIVDTEQPSSKSGRLLTESVFSRLHRFEFASSQGTEQALD